MPIPASSAATLLLAAAAAGGGLAAPNEVEVIGHRREITSPRAAGQGAVFRPENYHGADMSALTARDASLMTLRGREPYQARSELPMIRAQDSHYAEIFVNDLKIFDPLSNLISELSLDVGLLGEVTVHKGVSPWDMPSLSPVGTLRLRNHGRGPSHFLLGFKAGPELGVRQDARLVWSDRPGPAGGTRRYLALPVTAMNSPGLKEYYDDNATPFNTADDSFRRLGNNDHSSWQVLPQYSSSGPEGGFNVIARSFGKREELPSFSRQNPSEASKKMRSDWLIGEWFLLHGPWRLGTGASLVNDELATKDPTASVLINTYGRSVSSRSRQLHASAALRADPVSVSVRLTGQAATADLQRSNWAASGFESESINAYAGVEWRLSTHALLAVKLRQEHRQSASFRPAVAGSADAEREEGDSTLRDRAVSLSLPFEGFLAYLQAADFDRPPSLFEVFGDGGLVRENLQLRPESVKHLEAGFHAWRGQLSLSGACFTDRVQGKIATVAASFSDYKAMNLGETETSGCELNQTAAWNGLEALASYTRLLPFEETANGSRLRIPFISSHVLALQLGGRFAAPGGFKASPALSARYQSEVFRDPLNTTEVEGFWTVDASIAGKSDGDGNEETELALAVNNLLNVRSLATRSGAWRGRTGFSGPYGNPLPARSVVVSLASKIRY